jgi:hypothetical protein
MTIPTGNVQELNNSKAPDCIETSSTEIGTTETHMIDTHILETTVR